MLSKGVSVFTVPKFNPSSPSATTPSASTVSKKAQRSAAAAETQVMAVEPPRAQIPALGKKIPLALNRSQHEKLLFGGKF